MTGDVDRMAIIAELKQFVDAPPPIAPHEFTVGDFTEAMGFGQSKARRELDRLIERGIVAGPEDRHRDGRRVKAYWRVEGGDDGE